MSQDTKQRLLEAACAVFARHGYEESTVQMIAAQAEANIAAVNYHYGSKADLYARYVAWHLERMAAEMPLLSQNPGDAKGQLEKFVSWFFERFYPEAPLRRLGQDLGAMKRDFADSIMETVIKPEFQNCRDFVLALLPPGAPEETVRQWVKAVMALLSGPFRGDCVYPAVFPGVPSDIPEVKRQAAHVTRLILDGLKAESRRIKTAAAG